MLFSLVKANLATLLLCFACIPLVSSNLPLYQNFFAYAQHPFFSPFIYTTPHAIHSHVISMYSHALMPLNMPPLCYPHGFDTTRAIPHAPHVTTTRYTPHTQSLALPLPLHLHSIPSLFPYCSSTVTSTNFHSLFPFLQILCTIDCEITSSLHTLHTHSTYTHPSPTTHVPFRLHAHRVHIKNRCGRIGARPK